MALPYRRVLSLRREMLFQVMLHGLVFSFYSYEDEIDSRIRAHHVVYFFHYALATAVISYGLIPQYFYGKKYLLFFAFTLLIIAGVITVEELILEQIFFPRSRGKTFPGVFYSLWEVLPVIVILACGKFAWDALGKQQEVEALRTAVRESELQFLKSQINPHFLFNNLNNLYSYAIAASPKTPTIILELSAVLRYMLYDCRARYVPLAKEVKHLENFTRLNELQIEERGTVNFRASSISGNYQIAPLILIVFVENAFKHSQATQSDGIFIDINVRLSDEGELHFVSKNSFQSVANTENLARGIGLANIRQRLQLLYPDAHQLDIRAISDCYEVKLQMKLEASKNV